MDIILLLCLSFVGLVVFRRWRLAGLAALMLAILLLVQEGGTRLFDDWALRSARADIERQVAAERMSYAPGRLIIRTLSSVGSAPKLVAYDPSGQKNTDDLYNMILSELDESCNIYWMSITMKASSLR